MGLCYPFFVASVARCQSDSEDHSSLVDDVVGEDSDSGVEEDDQDLDVNLTSAPGVETVCVFPKNSAKCKGLFMIPSSSLQKSILYDDAL